MINRFSSEIFAQRPVRSEYQRGKRRGPHYQRFFILGGLFLVAVAIGYGVYAFWNEENVVPDEIPHIQAAFPIKERPENPGGIDIPHQDVEVFNQLDDGETATVDGAVEHLLPVTASPRREDKHVELGELVVLKQDTEETAPNAPEEESKKEVKEEEKKEEEARSDGLPPPITEAVVAADDVVVLNQLSPDTKEEKSVKPEAENTVKVEAPTQTEAKSITEAAPNIEKKKNVVKETIKKTIEKKIDPQVKKAEVAMTRLPEELFTGQKVPESAFVNSTQKEERKGASSKKTGVTARIQIASFPEESAAKKELSRYSKRLASSLSGVKLEVVRADISGKGTYYRIMTERLDQAKANLICEDMKRKNGSCLVRKL